MSATGAQPGVPRGEHPRPDFMRAEWRTLNGQWEFEFDDQDRGLGERWFRGDRPFSKRITVPYAFQTRLSGIGETAFHDIVWYRRPFEVPAAWQGRRVLLNFGAVDYVATVWVNGEQVAKHRGGHTPFSADVTDWLKPSDNVVTVRVEDPSTDRTIPRGKQYWKETSESIFYTRTTGIWQPVWVEAVQPARITALRMTPDIDRAQVLIQAASASGTADQRLRVSLELRGEPVARSESACGARGCTTVVSLERQELWSPERPTLYDATIELVTGSQVRDVVKSYVGLRKVAVHDGRVYLNNAPYYLRLVLDQGYWPESLLTPPSDEAIQYDIKMTKAMGFNGARKHQKVEDPRWLYWADRMGLLVWGEMANAYFYSAEYVSRFVSEWQEAVARDYNHPSIIAWVPINESWGVPDILTDAVQQEHVKSLYHLTRSLDATRFVVDNDGWEHTDATDLMTIHDYARTGAELAAKYEHLTREPGRIPRNGREALAYGYKYNGTPFLLTEFGGIAFRVGAQQAKNEWGYSGIEPTQQAFLDRLNGLVKAIRENRAWVGYCYTQLTDVEQEINGVMTYDRKPKADPEVLRKIFVQ
ncbi:MAG TPA: glycoside hydrolase family 2 TIM barrel-domain containing protein [Vicinamibacterales bacterium]|nr:glycoside hydrolase family 2 TIM barrel-domain containing protein [Vicinamibacterales bacterium]